MTHLITKRSVSRFFDRLISVEDLTLEESGRRKLFVLFLLIIVIPLSLFGIYHLITDHQKFGIINSIVSFIMVILIITLRKSKSANLHFRIISLIFLSGMTYWTYKGAINGHASIINLIYPPFVFFLLGRKEGLILSVILLFFSALIMINPYRINDNFDYQTTYSVRHILSFIILIFFSYHYENVREKFKAAMLLEKRKLEDHKNNLENIIEERTEEIQKTVRKLEVSRDELIDSEKRYRLLADTVTDLIWATDLNLNYSYVSPSVKTMFGMTVEEATNRSFYSWISNESLEKFKTAHRYELEREQQGRSDPNRNVILEIEQIRRDGSVFPVEMKMSFMRDQNKKAIGIVGISRDITERKESEKEKQVIQEQLAQAQKMEAIGTLAGGLSHDFNNILSVIMGSINLVQITLSKERLLHRVQIYKYLEIAMESSERSANIIKQLLSLSRKEEFKLIPLDINTSLNRIYDICKNSFPKSVILDFELSDEPLFVLAEPLHIEQVLLNLCINASHAMTIMKEESQKQGGVLRIKINTFEKHEHLADKNSIMNDSEKWLRINVTDTGVGINEDAMNRIFEPFYTTKSKEEGTGLGLATSYRIIEQHHGHLCAHSVPGKFTTFSIYLPHLLNEERNKHNRKESKNLILGKGKILLIDDEKNIIEVVSEILKKCGYVPLAFNDYGEAIELYRNRFDEIDAVLCDLSMPGKSGMDVAEILLEINPSAIIILSSGRIEHREKIDALRIGVKDFLDKPYMAYELSKSLSDLLKVAPGENVNKVAVRR